MKQALRRTALLLVGLAAGVHSADTLQLRGGPAAPLLDSAVIQRSLNELSLAKNANVQATASAQAARTARQDYVSHVSIKNAMKDYEKIQAEVPEARAAALTARKYAMMARQHADHTLAVASASRHIPEVAAQRSREAVEGWIKSDATKAAAATAVSPKEFAKSKSDKVAARVAAAAEPYHLALLRNQKFATETYSKAKSAQKSSQELQTKAKSIALKAQELQAAGLGVDAQEMMSEAHGMMQEAENMRQWAVKLYNQANTADGSAGGYTLSEQQAAKNAAMTTVVNAPMKLPLAAL